MQNDGSMSAEPRVERPDPDAVRRFALKVWQFKQGELVSIAIHAGDRLGLYQALAAGGAMGAQQLAAATGCDERWLEEWLRGQAAAGLLSYEEDDGGMTFTLEPFAAPVLADDETSPLFAAGAFTRPKGMADADAVVAAMRMGGGFTYEDQGHEAVRSMERMHGPWARLVLAQHVIPALDGVADTLRQGAMAVDVGCGPGTAVVALAKAFPESRFVGYDPSYVAIERAMELAEGVDNAEFVVAGGEDLPTTPTFDLITAFDSLHDMPHPDATLAAMRRAIKDDGTLLIKDIKSAARFEDNLKNPLLAMMYGFSLTSCLPSALSDEGGMGLGTLGLHPELAEQMVRQAGFGHFQMHDLDDPTNFYYEVRV